MTLKKELNIEQFQAACNSKKSLITLVHMNDMSEYSSIEKDHISLFITDSLNSKTLNKGDSVRTFEGFSFILGPDNNIIKNRASLLLTMLDYKDELGLNDDFIMCLGETNKNKYLSLYTNLIKNAKTKDAICEALRTKTKPYFARSVASRISNNSRSVSVKQIKSIIAHPSFNIYFKYFLDAMFVKNVLDISNIKQHVTDIINEIPADSTYPKNNLLKSNTFYTYW